MPGQLNLFLLGQPQILTDDAPVTGFISSKAQALLVYLAVTGRPHSREALAGLLWGDMAEHLAAKNLRNALSNLRALAGDHLTITRESAAFNREQPYWLDVENFVSALTRSGAPEDVGTLHRAVELFQATFWKVSTSAARWPWKNGSPASARC